MGKWSKYMNKRRNINSNKAIKKYSTSLIIAEYEVTVRHFYLPFIYPTVKIKETCIVRRKEALLKFTGSRGS